MASNRQELVLWALRNELEAQRLYKMSRVGEHLKEISERRRQNYWRRRGRWLAMYLVAATFGAALGWQASSSGLRFDVSFGASRQSTTEKAQVLAAGPSASQSPSPPAPSSSKVANGSIESRLVVGAPLDLGVSPDPVAPQPIRAPMPTPLVLPTISSDQIKATSDLNQQAQRSTPVRLQEDSPPKEAAVDSELASAIENARERMSKSSVQKAKNQSDTGVSVTLPKANKALVAQQVTPPLPNQPDASPEIKAGGFSIVAFLDTGLMVRVGQEVRHVAIGEKLPNGKTLAVVDPVARKYNSLN